MSASSAGTGIFLVTTIEYKHNFSSVFPWHRTREITVVYFGRKEKIKRKETREKGKEQKREQRE